MRWILFLSWLWLECWGVLLRPRRGFGKPRHGQFKCPEVTSEPRPCPNDPKAMCGYIMRPLDSSGEVPGDLAIYFRHRLRSEAQSASLGTLVGMTGGPGYGSTATAPDYELLWGNLLHTRDTVTVDQRGTGCSGVINCPSVQLTNRITAQNVSDCGKVLGAKIDLYGMQQAAADVAAVLDLLNITTPVDLYGESYGTFAVQAFAGNFPSRVRSIVVDGAYSVLSLNAWLPGMMADTRAAFRFACERDVTRCVWDMDTFLKQLLGEIRADPPTGPPISRGGGLPPSPLTPTDLAYLMTTAGLNPLVYTEFVAALAANDAAQPQPLIRMASVAYTAYEGGAGSDIVEYSMGMLVATFCQDSPQVFNLTLAPDLRNFSGLVKAKQQTDPDLYYPFTVQEWVDGPFDYSYIGLCQTWPVGSSNHPPGVPVPSHSLPDVPVLVLTGDLDSITPICQGDQCAADYLHAQRIIVPNGVHVVALDGPDCLSEVVQAFISKGGPVDNNCTATAYPPLRMVVKFALYTGEIPEATSLSGTTSLDDLRAAAGAVYTAADAVNHFNMYAEEELGLYGGHWNSTSTSSQSVIQFWGLKWTSDLSVDGSVTISEDFSVRGRVTLSGVAVGSVDLTWSMTQDTNATIQGAINNHVVNATMRPL